MGVAIYVRLENGDSVACEMDGKALSSAQEALDKHAKKAKLTPLMSFYSANMDDLAGLVDDVPVETDSMPKEEWFDADDGLKTVREFIKLIQKKSVSLKNAEAVLDDLKNMERLLAAAKKDNVRFHICLDI